MKFNIKSQWIWIQMPKLLATVIALLFFSTVPLFSSAQNTVKDKMIKNASVNTKTGSKSFVGKVKALSPDEISRVISIPPDMGKDMIPVSSPQGPPSTSISLRSMTSPGACSPVSFKADLDENGTPEDYRMVSFLACDGRNFVSREKSQRGGSCSTYSMAAAMEIMLGMAIRSKIPNTLDPNDFLPIDLSEGTLMYTQHNNLDTNPVLKGISAWQGAATEAFFPDSELWPNWGEWHPEMAYALQKRFGSVSTYCADIKEPALTSQELADLANPNLPNGCDPDKPEKVCKDRIWSKRFMPIFNCLMDAAKKKQARFVTPSAAIPLDKSGNDASIDQLIKDHIKFGFPIRTSIGWHWGDNPKAIDVSLDGKPTESLYKFIKLQPIPVQDALDKGDCKGFKKTVSNKTYCLSHGHSVLIIGYLESTTGGGDYWIIKNSHADSQAGQAANKRPQDEFFLVQTPSTSGNIDNNDSTKRNLVRELYSFSFFTHMTGHKMSTSINNASQLIVAPNQDDANFFVDSDTDGVIDLFDNCPYNANQDQKDSDKDSIGDVCDPCPNKYDRYQYRSNPNLLINDLDNDGKSALCDNETPPAGLGVFALSGTALTLSGSVLRQDQFAGDWRYSLSHKVLGTADVDNDGKTDVILRSSWGIGVISFNSNSPKSKLAIPFGTKIGSWELSSTDNFLGVANLDSQDGAELIFTDAKNSLGILEFKNGQLVQHQIIPNDTSVGEWRRGTNDKIVAMGRFRAVTRKDILVRSPWGIGILGTSDLKKLISLGVHKYDTMLGDWRLGSNDKFEGLGDFDGDGKDEIIVRSNWGIGILKKDSSITPLKSIAMHQKNTRIGDWVYNNDDKVEGVDDFNGDGRDDILLSSNWGLGIVTLGPDKKLTTIGLIAYNTKITNRGGTSSWKLTSSDSIVGTGNLNGDNQAVIILRNSWGLGIVGISAANQFKLWGSQQNGTKIGSWYLRAENNIIGVEQVLSLAKDGLITKTY